MIKQYKMIRKYILYISSAIGLVLSLTCIGKEVSVTPVEVHVVLLAGQSNMAGGGDYDLLSDSIKNRIVKVSNRVMLSFNGKPAIPLSYYKNKPGKKYDFAKRFGPELLIGLTLAEKNPNQKYLLIKKSQGGTSLYGAWNPQWTIEKAKALEKGDFKKNVKLYNLHIQDIHKNLKSLKNSGKTYKIIGLAWMQGENDAAHEVSAKTYSKNAKALITSYRKDLSEPEIPFVMGQINSAYGDFDKGPKIVRTAISKAVNSDCCTDYIATSTDRSWLDYPKHPDNVHYNTEGQKRLGIAFANSIIGLNEKSTKNRVKN